MSASRRASFLFIAPLFLAALSAPGAEAGFCRNYASSAVAQQSRNLRNHCGFSGPRWSSDYNAHFLWCKLSSRKKVRREQAIRARYLANNCGGSRRQPPVLMPPPARPPATRPRSRLPRLQPSPPRPRLPRLRPAPYRPPVTAAPPRLDPARENYCQYYAKRVVSDVRHYAKFGCRLGASGNYYDNFNDCLQISRRQGDARLTALMQKGNACIRARNKPAPVPGTRPGGTPAVADGCNELARRAVKQDLYYSRFGCSLNRGKMESDFFNTCMRRNMSPYARKDFLGRRDNKGQACLRRMSAARAWPRRGNFCNWFSIEYARTREAQIRLCAAKKNKPQANLRRLRQLCRENSKTDMLALLKRAAAYIAACE